MKHTRTKGEAMGFLSKFEGRMEDTFEGAADRMAKAPISPVQIAKKAEKEMRREKMVGAGKQYAPTLYTVLVNPDDDRRLFGYYPTLAGETETYLSAKAAEHGYVMDGQPLVRFIIDNGLKHGKFDVIAEPVAAPIVAKLRSEEMQRYGLESAPQYGQPPYNEPQYGAGQADYYDEYPYAAAAAPVEPVMAANTAMFVGGQVASAPMDSYRAPQPARLINAETNQSFTLGSARLVIGRESKNDIALQDLNASRTHAELNLDPQGIWTLTDLGSTNGTFVNGRLVASHPLREGDRIAIGVTTFIFTQS